MAQSVAFGLTDPVYNTDAPYHPDTGFPELGFRDISSRPNKPYTLLRQLLRDLGLDAPRFGTREWNPFGTMVRPGQTVLIKPNFVLSANFGGGDLFAVVTHPSILRAVVDYVYLALRGQGRIIIADVPQMDCDWEELMCFQKLSSIQEFYASVFKFPIEVYDLRDFAVIDRRKLPLTENRKKLSGDPAGSAIINLGRKSHFCGIDSRNFYGADYNRQETIAHHSGETQEYCVSKTMLSADVFISVPKMKTHKKVGVTLNLKGLVGMNTNKNYLVHYRLGTPAEGGDQLPASRTGKDRFLVKAQRAAYDALLARKSGVADKVYQFLRSCYRATLKPFVRVSQDTYDLDGGNWHGNDSAWRMTADLAKILYFADRTGKLCDTPQRQIFSIVDGIVAGERSGPLEPKPKACGCLVAGANPFAVDLVTTRLMGFSPQRLHQFDIAFDAEWDFGLRSLADIQIAGPNGLLDGNIFFTADNRVPNLRFEPHPGWVGQIEV